MIGTVKKHGERPCRKCGEPHDCYWISGPSFPQVSWAAQDDSHTYEPLSWEEMYRKAVAA